MQPCDVRADLKTRIERKEALSGDFGLASTHILRSIDDLPLKVGKTHHVIIDDCQTTDAGCCEVQKHRTTQPTGTDNRNRRSGEPCLAFMPDVLQA